MDIQRSSVKIFFLPESYRFCTKRLPQILLYLSKIDALLNPHIQFKFWITVVEMGAIHHDSSLNRKRMIGYLILCSPEYHFYPSFYLI